MGWFNSPTRLSIPQASTVTTVTLCPNLYVNAKFVFHKLPYVKDQQLSLHLSTGVLLSNKTVHQSPSELLKSQGDQVKLTLTHKIPNYNTILWYERSKGDSVLQLIGYTYYKSVNVEPSFTRHFVVTGDGENTASLHILRVERSAEYFGAASYHSYENSFSVLQKPKRWKGDIRTPTRNHRDHVTLLKTYEINTRPNNLQGRKA